MFDTSQPSQEKENSAFNSAVACLMRIDGILREIKDLVLNKELSNSARQIKKLKLMRELFVQSYPLIDEEQAKKLKESVISFKLYSKQVSKWNPIIKEHELIDFIIYSEQKETELNNLIIDIEVALQDKGLLMPSKESTRGL